MSYFTKKFDDQVITLIKEGGLGFMPSDTIYGLSASALNGEAVDRLHQIKDREEHKPFIILISNINMLDLLSIEKKQADPAAKYWPGALTLICLAPAAPDWLHLGLRSLAVRMPAKPELKKLIDSVGPLISTSANISGSQPLQNVAQAKKVFGEQLEFYVDAGEISGQPSTIVRSEGDKLIVLRRGAVKI